MKKLLLILALSSFMSCRDKVKVIETNRMDIRIDTLYTYKIKYSNGTMGTHVTDEKLNKGDKILVYP